MIDEWLRRLGPSLVKARGHCYLVKDMEELLACKHCSLDSSSRNFTSFKVTLLHTSKDNIWVFFSLKHIRLCLTIISGNQWEGSNNKISNKSIYVAQ